MVRHAVWQCVCVPACVRVGSLALMYSEQPVRGLYAWCQGCAHGGHLHHMKEWFTKNNLCPAGCGHACDLRSQFK